MSTVCVSGGQRYRTEWLSAGESTLLYCLPHQAEKQGNASAAINKWPISVLQFVMSIKDQEWERKYLQYTKSGCTLIHLDRLFFRGDTGSCSSVLSWFSWTFNKGKVSGTDGCSRPWHSYLFYCYRRLQIFPVHYYQISRFAFSGLLVMLFVLS